MPDYGKIIKRSFEILKKHKWLLVYGLVLSSLGGSAGFRGYFPSGLGDKEPPQNIPEGIRQSTQVLGTFTSSIKLWLQGVPVSFWILIGLAAILLFSFAFLVSLVVKTWAKGALIYAGFQALDERQVTLINTSPKGLASAKNLIIFSLIIFALAAGIFIGLPAFWAIVFFLLKSFKFLKTFWIIIGASGGFVAFVLSIVLLAMVAIYAERLIVLKDYSPWDAWKKAFSISKKSFLPTFIMGIINSILATSAGCLSILVLLIVLGIPAFILVYPSVKAGELPPLITFIALGILLIIFIYANLAIRAAIVVFKFSNWNQLFLEVLDKVEEGKNG